MRKHRLVTYTLLIFCMLLCSLSLFALGSKDLYLDGASEKKYDLSLTDTPDTPTSYIHTAEIWNLPGFIGRIKYIGQATTLTFRQTPSSNTSLFYFTHNTIPNVWSEYFLVGNVRAKKGNQDVTITNFNTIFSKDGDFIEIPVRSGNGQTYSSTWVDLVLVRKNQLHQDIIPNGNYKTNFTITSSTTTDAITINLEGYRNAAVSATAWLSLTPDFVAIDLTGALLSNKVEVVEARMNLQGDNYGQNYGVILTFRDNTDPNANGFKFRHTALGDNAAIPFKLRRGTNSTQTTLISPKVPIIWDNLSFASPNIWKLFITGIEPADIQKCLSGNYKTTIRVEITPLDSNVYIE